MIRKGSLRNTRREPHDGNSDSRVLKENNRNTSQKGRAYLFMFLRDKNLERGG
jgi:hypothetical protein